MEEMKGFGELNGHAIGTVIKAAMMRVMQRFTAMQFQLVVEEKPGYEPGTTDIRTNMDSLAQEVYVKIFRKSFPHIGIVAEENAPGSKERLVIPPRHGCKMWFDIDGIDGTKAMERKQSDGIGTMVSLRKGNEIIAAYVGDVTTGEIYGYRPGSQDVWRVNRGGVADKLRIDPERPLADQHVLLRDPGWEHSLRARWLFEPGRYEGGALFKSIQIGGGSIGIGMARLWKGEVGGTILLPSAETPWDANPVLGICQRLGFVNLDITGRGFSPPYKPKPVRNILHRERETLIIHESRVPELMAWMKRPEER